MIARRVSIVKMLQTDIGFQTEARSVIGSFSLDLIGCKHKFENRPDYELLFYIGDKIDSFGHQRVS